MFLLHSNLSPQYDNTIIMLCILDKMNVKKVLSIALNRKSIISIILLLLLWLIYISMSHRDVDKSYIFERTIIRN